MTPPKKQYHVCMAVLNDITHDSRVLREGNALVSAGFKVSIVGLQSDTSPKNEELIGDLNIYRVKKFTNNNIFQYSYRDIIKYYSPLFTYGTQNAKNLYKKLFSIPADIYQANDLDTLLCVFKAAKKKNIPFIYDVHELSTETANQSKFNSLGQWLYKKYYSYIEKRYIRKAKAVMTVNESIADELVLRYTIKKPLILLNVPPLQKSYSKENWKKIFNLPVDSKIILYQGNLGMSRGIFQLIDAVPLLPINYYLIFLGYGNMFNQAQRKVNELKLTSRIKFHPPVSQSDLVSFTAAADVGVAFIEQMNLSKKFALPNKLFEYMMAGLPIVCTDLPEMKKVITECKNGNFVINLKPESIALAIKKIIESDEYDSMRKNSLKFAATKYNWQSASSEFVGLYNSILNTNREKLF